MESPDATVLVPGTVEEVLVNERLVTSNVLEINGVTDFTPRLDVAFAGDGGSTEVNRSRRPLEFRGGPRDVGGRPRLGRRQRLERLDVYLRTMARGGTSASSSSAGRRVKIARIVERDVSVFPHLDVR